MPTDTLLFLIIVALTFIAGLVGDRIWGETHTVGVMVRKALLVCGPALLFSIGIALTRR